MTSRAAPPTKGTGTVKNLAELTLQIRTNLAIDRAREVTDENPSRGKGAREERAREGEALFFNVRFSFGTHAGCNWTPSESLRAVKSFAIFPLGMKPIPVKTHRRKNTCYMKENIYATCITTMQHAM